MYYTKSALAGGICCSITHGAVCPVDVVKTRIQLEPQKYNSGMIGGFRTVIAEEGVMALSTGLAATAVGYFVQGWFKFGGVELFKIKAASMLGEKGAWENRTAIYLGAAACAEFVADCFLCLLARKGRGRIAQQSTSVQLHVQSSLLTASFAPWRERGVGESHSNLPRCSCMCRVRC